ncbi:MAG TPA: ATP-binding protein [Kofleriaceae bacterium]|nr:ATP-binding protein [Kofleriaceae bacterium]
MADHAVDPDGKLLAIRLTSGVIELAPISEGARAITHLPASRPNISDYSSAHQPSAPVAHGLPASRPDISDYSVEVPKLAETPMGGAQLGPECQPVEIQPAGARSTEQCPTAAALPSDIPACPVQPLDPPPIIVDALEPRAIRAQMPREAALIELDRELHSVILWVLAAISRAWDTRRLSYGNEGHHPYEHEVAALVGKNSGFAPDYLAGARDALAEHEVALAADPHYRSELTPIGELIDEFRLSTTAINVLLVIAAPSLHGDVARLYGILGNDPGRAMVDELLVQHILSDRVTRHDVAAELHPQAPLVRLGMVDVKKLRPRPFAALEVDPVVLSRLRGEPPELGVASTVRHATRELASIDLAPGVLASAISTLARAPRPARIAIRGHAGVGRRTLFATFAHRAGRSLCIIDAARLPRDAEQFIESLQITLRRAQLAGLIPVIYALDAVVFGDRNAIDLAREILTAHPGPLAVLSPLGTSPPLPAGHMVIDLPAMAETARLGVWQRAFEGSGHWLRDVTSLASRYRVGPGIIYRAVASVTGDDPMTPCDDRIDAFLRQSREIRLSDHAQRVHRLANWADLVLPPDIMDSLRELVGRVRYRRTVFEEWGMGRTMTTSRGLTALFQGQPGTGKTLVAGVIARELGLDLYQVDLSKVMSKWIGETERNLATIFDAADDGQVILLFDEADSLFAKRTEVRSSNDRYANLEVNYLLQRLDAFEGIAILTTNNGGSIDPAFKRRLSFRLSFPFPDEETRAELWRAHLPRELPRTGELTFDVLARKYQLSGGYIRNACLRAAFLAAQEETLLQQHHLERAVALEFAELGKLSTGGAIM